MKKSSIVAMSIMTGIVSLLCIIEIGTINANATSPITPPPLTLTVDVSQDPDACSCESPCTCYVTIRQGGVLLGATPYDAGPGKYYVDVPSNTSGSLTATIEQSPGCDCQLNVYDDYQSGPPYPEFNVTVY